MKIYPAQMLQLESSIVAIGAFDGVHRGHQAVIRHAVEAARHQRCPSVVYTFNPPPKSHFLGARMLTAINEKLRRIEALQSSHAIVAEFDQIYAARSVDAFLDELADLNPREIWVGSDFRFGAKGVGDVAILAERFNVCVIDPVRCGEGAVISSTRIRDLLEGSDPLVAEGLLGWFPEAAGQWEPSLIA